MPATKFHVDDDEDEMVHVHFHESDYPATIDLLDTIMGDRDPSGGYQRTDTGRWVCWDLLTSSYLSGGETAAVYLAKGLAAVEGRGGLTGPIADAALRAVTEVVA